MSIPPARSYTHDGTVTGSVYASTVYNTNDVYNVQKDPELDSRGEPKSTCVSVKTCGLTISTIQFCLGVLLLLIGIVIVIQGQCMYLYGQLIFANLCLTTGALIFYASTERTPRLMYVCMVTVGITGVIFFLFSATAGLWLLIISQRETPDGQGSWVPVSSWFIVSLTQLWFVIHIRQMALEIQEKYGDVAGSNLDPFTDTSMLPTADQNDVTQRFLQDQQQPLPPGSEQDPQQQQQWRESYMQQTFSDGNTSQPPGELLPSRMTDV